MSDAEDSLALAIAGELRILVGRLKRRMREQSQLGELTWSQVGVLSKLEREGPATVTTLAKADGMRPQSMGAIVAALEASRHVVGAADPADGRQTLWSITPEARTWLLAARAAREDWLVRTIQAKLSPAEQAALASAVKLIERLAEP